MRCERGQATIEWVGLVLLASLALGALATAAPVVDGRSLGGALAYRIVCAARGAPCDEGQGATERAYGARDAELVRRHAPSLVYEPGERSLPVDWRRCRERGCAQAPDDRDLDAHRTDAGLRATAFTRVVRRGGSTYVQYWLYYPDSNTAAAGSDTLWKRSLLAQVVTRLATGRYRYPGYHPDDWEAYAVRIDARGRVSVRASSHGHWQWCKTGACRDRWGRATGLDPRVARQPRGTRARGLGSGGAAPGLAAGLKGGAQAAYGPNPGGAHARAHQHRGGIAPGAAGDAGAPPLPAAGAGRAAPLAQAALCRPGERRVVSQPVPCRRPEG